MSRYRKRQETVHSPIRTKICGISTLEAVDAVIAGGAVWLGFIFFPKSPRNVTPDQAAVLSRHAGDRVKKVAVTVDADDGFLQEIVTKVKPDLLQLHGSETPERVAAIRRRFGLPVIKAFAIRALADFATTAAYEGIADMFLFDAKPPAGSDLPGGNGVSFDWRLMRRFESPTPWILSGGLDMANVRVAVRSSGANAIDMSSGVESAPGVKDIDLIRQLLQETAEIHQEAAA